MEAQTIHSLSFYTHLLSTRMVSCHEPFLCYSLRKKTREGGCTTVTKRIKANPVFSALAMARLTTGTIKINKESP